MCVCGVTNDAVERAVHQADAAAWFRHNTWRQGGPWVCAGTWTLPSRAVMVAGREGGITADAVIAEQHRPELHISMMFRVGDMVHREASDRGKGCAEDGALPCVRT